MPLGWADQPRSKLIMVNYIMASNGQTSAVRCLGAWVDVRKMAQSRLTEKRKRIRNRSRKKSPSMPAINRSCVTSQEH